MATPPDTPHRRAAKLLQAAGWGGYCGMLSFGTDPALLARNLRESVRRGRRELTPEETTALEALDALKGPKTWLAAT
jgi:hypothetical protein